MVCYAWESRQMYWTSGYAEAMYCPIEIVADTVYVQSLLVMVLLTGVHGWIMAE